MNAKQAVDGAMSFAKMYGVVITEKMKREAMAGFRAVLKKNAEAFKKSCGLTLNW